MKPERLVRPALDFDVERLELLDQRYSVLRFELFSPSEGKPQIAGKALLDPTFGLEIAQRNGTAKSDESFAVDARPRRIAVDDPRKDVERVALPLH